MRTPVSLASVLEKQLPTAPARGDFRVLVADDNPDDAVLLRVGFEEARVPARLDFVEDGDAVLSFLERRGPKASPDLLLLDLKMPRKDGFQVLEWLQSHPEWNGLPVIVFSGSDQPVNIDRAMKLGARRYLVKPHRLCEFVQLAENVHKYCRRLHSSAPGPG